MAALKKLSWRDDDQSFYDWLSSGETSMCSNLNILRIFTKSDREDAWVCKYDGSKEFDGQKQFYIQLAQYKNWCKYKEL